MKVWCEVCGKKAIPRSKIVTNPSDGSKWIHYDCEGGHTFHRTIAGNPVKVCACDCAESK
jgi:lysyl-tRNA synthetase class I